LLLRALACRLLTGPRGPHVAAVRKSFFSQQPRNVRADCITQGSVALNLNPLDREESAVIAARLVQLVPARLAWRARS
jgi:hypothetical protein